LVEKANRESVDGTAFMEREEIEEIRDVENLKDLIKERTDEQEHPA
jgi:putative transcriptional regulator